MSEQPPEYTPTIPGLELDPEQNALNAPKLYRNLLETMLRARMMEVHELRRQLGLPKLNERKR